MNSISKLNRAVFPGSFDPITNGHIDIIRRTLNIFDAVTVGVLTNASKDTLFSVEQRVDLIKEEFQDCGNAVSVRGFSGLLVDFVKEENASVIIRGLRAISDYDYEAQLALMNKTLARDIETLFMTTSEKNSYINSSLVRQVAKFGGSVAEIVPPHVVTALKDKYQK